MKENFIIENSTLKKYIGKNFIEVKIPTGVTCIGKDAFMDADVIRVFIPDGVKKIEDGAFAGCIALEAVRIPSTVQTIGEEAFSCCYSLSDIYLPMALKEIKNSTFYRCNAFEDIELPNGIEKICEDAFAECKNLKKITIPESVKFIEDRAFRECPHLENLILKNKSVKNITVDQRAFEFSPICVLSDGENYNIYDIQNIHEESEIGAR